MYTHEDVLLLAKCGWMEGRDKGAISMAAVMHVVMNRVMSSDFPNTISAVINRHNQFSWTQPDNPEYGRNPTQSTGADLEAWTTALGLAEDILTRILPDPTFGACYYEAPSWFSQHIAGPDLTGMPGHEFTVEIGGQRYYR